MIPPGATGPDPQLQQLDQEIAALAGRAEQHRSAWQATLAELAAAQDRRQTLLWQRYAAAQSAAAPAPQPATPPAAASPARPDQRTAGPAAAARPEASTRTVQNVLFVLGGLLLATAAVVFTAVAWATFGNAGRAVILAGVTAVALAVPLLAWWRGLRATAETFVVLGMLLVVLDGYAAWYVDLFGDLFGARQMSGVRYAAVVCAVTALVGALYRIGTKLTGPGVVATLVALPVLPLWAAPARPTLAGWALIFTAVAAGYLIVVRSRVGLPVRVPGWTMHGLALVIAVALALAAELDATRTPTAALAGATLLATAGVLTAGSILSRSVGHRACAGFAIVLAIVIAGARLVDVAWPGYRVAGVAAVIATTVLAAGAVRRRIPAQVWPAQVWPAQVWLGPWIASLLVTAGLMLVLGLFALIVAITSVYRATPMWRASLNTHVELSWQYLAAIALGTVAAIAAAQRPAARHAALAVGVVLATLTVPGAVAHTWWTASVVDIAVAGVLAVTAARSGTTAVIQSWGAGAAILLMHAVPASLARPANTAGVLAAACGLGIAVAVASRPRSAAEAAATVSRERRALGGLGLLVAQLALPPAVGASLIAFEVSGHWAARLSTTSLLLLAAATTVVRRGWPALLGYAYAATLISTAIWPAAVAVAAGESLGIYAASALVLIAVAVAATTHRLESPAGAGSAAAAHSTAYRPAAIAAAVPVALLVVADVLPAVLAVVALPYSWLGSVWSGEPAGVGLAPPGVGIDKPFVSVTHAVALGLVAVASAVTAYTLRPRVSSIIFGLGVGGPTAILVWLTAAQAPWPIVPATTLLLGVLLVTSVALNPVSPRRGVIGGSQGLLYAGAGLAGALTVQWSTVAGLAAIVVGGVTVGWLGLHAVVRLLGWAAAVSAGIAAAAAAALASGLPAREAAFVVLATAAGWLAAGSGMRRRGAEAALVQTGAHLGAVVALLLSAPWVAYAAAVCTLWGIVVAARALLPGTGRAARIGTAAIAAAWELLAWWLLLAYRDVAIVEAYTLPLAGVVLLGGWAALRARPELSSWAAYGPALAAAFLPSLATVIALSYQAAPAEQTVWRRLLLGVGALVVVIAGTLRRRQAPVVVGGAVLAVVAIHETVLFWDLVPRWIPLALGGLLLLGLAITYERRRRDLTRLRAAIGRMT